MRSPKRKVGIHHFLDLFSEQTATFCAKNVHFSPHQVGLFEKNSLNHYATSKFTKFSKKDH